MVIVAAVDRSDRASSVVATADELARAFDEPLHVVHVLTRSDFVELGRSSADETDDPLSMDRIREAAASIAADAARAAESRIETVGLVGDPDERIISYAEELDARYVVVGPRKRSPTGKALFGSVAQSVLLNAGRPVVTVVD